MGREARKEQEEQMDISEEMAGLARKMKEQNKRLLEMLGQDREGFGRLHGLSEKNKAGLGSAQEGVTGLGNTALLTWRLFFLASGSILLASIGTYLVIRLF